MPATAWSPADGSPMSAEMDGMDDDSSALPLLATAMVPHMRAAP
jgi:hypothetical protein